MFVVLASPGITSATLFPANVRLFVREAGADAPLPCRVHLTDAAGKAVLPAGFPAFQTHIVCDGNARFALAAGRYAVSIERGPEYTAINEHWEIEATRDASFAFELRRLSDVAREGWWSGDLHVHRKPADIELLMRADDLHVAPVITWWRGRNQWATVPVERPYLVKFDRDRFYRLMAGEDERMGGALLYFGLEEPLPLANQTPEYKSPVVLIPDAKARGAWVDVEKPFWYDVPVWLASGLVDSVGLANNHMQRHTMLANEAWGRARDLQRFPGPHGNGLWSQEIYYHILNAGLRVPPSAGSASGVLPNPVGYNRVYVQLDGELTYDAWWQALRAGRSFVSNGPLLRVKANGQWPGHIFRGAAGEAMGLNFEVKLDGRDRLSRLEIIHNGRVVKSVSGDEWQRTRSLGSLQVTDSGWFLVRAIADVAETFRFASTAPFHVEIGGPAPRVSRASAQFFLDWARERAERIRLTDPEQQAEVLKIHRDAEAFWQRKVESATAR